MPSKFWDDFTLGQKVRTPAITVTETHVVNWAGLTLDFYPLHMDKEFASKTVFKERIAHGPLTFALGVGLMYQTGVAEDSVIAWLGADINRIPAPVKLGDTIHVEAEVSELRETKTANQGVMIMRYNVVNQRAETVMVYDMKFLMHKRVKQAA